MNERASSMVITQPHFSASKGMKITIHRFMIIVNVLLVVSWICFYCFFTHYMAHPEQRSTSMSSTY